MQLILRIVMLCSLFSLAEAKLPEGMAGTLLVVNKSDNNVNLIDLVSGKIVTTLPTGQGPHELVVSSDGRWAVTTDYVGGNSLTVIDVTNKKVARTIDLSRYPRPHGIQFLPNQRHVVVSSESSQKVARVDIHSGKVISNVNTQQAGSHMVAVQQNGNLAYTTNMQADTLSVLDLKKNLFIKTLTTDKTPEAITVSRSGHEIWYGANGKGLVTVIEPKHGKVLEQWTGFSFPYRVLLTQDERLAIVPDFRNHYVRFFDAKHKTELARLTLEKGAGPQGVVLHPDDKTLFLSLNAKNKVLAIDVNNREVLAEFKTGNNPDGIGYSPLRID